MDSSAKLPGRHRFVSPMPASDAKLTEFSWVAVALCGLAAVASLTFTVLLFLNR